MPRCLVIDGSPIIRKVSRLILTDFGYEVADAANGRDGISIFNRHRPDIAMVDSQLQDVAALDVLRHMRDTCSGEVYVLYCTVSFDYLELQRAHAAGASDVLIKPFDRESLAAKLDARTVAETKLPRPNFYTRLSRSELMRTS